MWDEETRFVGAQTRTLANLSDALVLTHVLLAPYTKLEESFNIHATHDVLIYDVRIDNLYNYFTFPSTVPRTFIGDLLAWIAVPVIQLAAWLGLIRLADIR